MNINPQGWRARTQKTRDPRPNDTGLWVFSCLGGRLVLETDGRYDEAVGRFRVLLDGRRPKDIELN
jgi:hypothetical protein